MKRIIIMTLVAATVLSNGFTCFNMPIAVHADEKEVNLIENGTIDNNNLDGWGIYRCNGGEGELSAQNNAINVQVDNCGELAYSMQTYYDGFKMYKNGKYRLKFDINSTVDRSIYYSIQLNRDDYRAYVGDIVDINNDVKTVSVDFTMKDENDLFPRLTFNLGNIDGTELPPHTVTIDNVSLVLLDGSGIEYDDEKPKEEQKIVLNQLGYKPDENKKAVFRVPTEDRVFKVVKDDTGETVYEGQIYGEMNNETAGENDRFGDFSKLKTPGTYRIETDSLGTSFKFDIGENVYDNAFKDAVRFFYTQRCGVELPEEYAGIWKHDKCHTSPARIYGTHKMIDVSGGWHDAGDYGRYVVASSKAIADLLSAYDDNKTAFGDDFNIPESGNGIPDVLDEVKLQLEWMLKMQEPTSGGVYHKVTCANFPGFVKPEEETDELIVCPISTTATADFAAVMAMGYENFKDIDSELAHKCLAAGERAWNYLENTPNSGGFKNPPEISTREYEDSDDSDERYWAAAQLFKATGKEKYDKAFKKILSDDGLKTGYGWASVGNYGTMAYLSAEGADKNVCGYIKNKVIDMANEIVSKSKNDGYNVSIGDNYCWGSNLEVTNNGIFLTKAYEITQNPEYLEYAKEHLNYCFGKNSVGMSYVTGYGSDAAKNPHHRPSIVEGQAIPGMLVGGPNKDLQDPYAKSLLKGKPAAQCYIDNKESYSTNEVDIYWNSPLVYLMSQTVKK
ncbi:MAG: glycoside hydrolase family 9 protein [Clostridium sp.]